MKYSHPLVAAIVANLGFKINLQETEEFIAGIIYGFVQHDDLQEIEKCFHNGQQVEAEIENIVSEFAKKDVTDIVKAVEDTVKLIQEFPSDLEDCKNIQGDLDKIADWAKNIHISAIPGNVVKHLLGITKDIQKIEDDWTAQNYEAAGEVVTDILFKVLGDPKEGDIPETPEFLF